ncbi:type I polyketide synthase [Allokutzneria oryzae]|uniref:SDR family NAD(P)-dependent oxidoreductase n=1 Tax=Allokutzneria oryzae TaxID=1378989 RepID=A0ABV5ZQF4_9PSEU
MLTDGIAIIGMSCRFPGGVDSPEALWRLLERGGDVVTEIPAERWDVDRYYDPEPGTPGRTVSKWGGFLDDTTGFDNGFFAISDAEAQAMDPQQRLLLELAWEAVEHAGRDPGSLAGSRTGVFAGASYHDYAIRLHEAGVTTPHVATGTAHSVASGRIAYLLDLTGPSVTVDTACSSALVAVHMACQSLRTGESDAALAGGVTVVLNPEFGVAASGWGMLSPDGRCFAFDKRANGFVRSEGVAMVLLKRLADAVADGDRVLAVIRGSAVNSDGRSDGLIAPSRAAQAEVQRAALAMAGIDPGRVGLIEAHGTGTPVGDPVEFAALAEVYGGGDRPCALGSVKTNIGHTEACSGLAGLIKAVQSLRHGVIPPNLNFTGWGEGIAPEGTRLFVPTELTGWPVTDGPRVAAVSSYGFSGTNAHVVVEQAPETATGHTEQGDGPWLFPLSASTPEALQATANRLADWLDERDPGLADLGHTLGAARGHRPHRAAVVAGTLAELGSRLRALAEGRPDAHVVTGQAHGGAARGPVLVFSGQGSQWAGMGRRLLDTEPAFAKTIEELDPLILAESGISVRRLLADGELPGRIDHIQPLLFACQVALAETWRARGVEPAAVIGHSMGESAAAVVAGALSMKDGAAVICRRSALMARLSGAGAMASVDLPEERVRAELPPTVSVAVIPSPGATVVAGDPASIDRLVAAWDERGQLARRVAVDIAAHSAQVDPILPELDGQLSDLRPLRPRIPFYTTVLGDPRATPAFDARYWADNLREPVRFSAAVRAAIADGHRVFVEAAPHPLLTHAIAETAGGRAVAALPTLRRDTDDQLALLTNLGQAHCRGAEVDWTAVHPHGSFLEAPLPVWHHRNFTVEPAAERVVGRPLLGAHIRLPDNEDKHIWQAEAGTDTEPWLTDHRVHDAVVMPGAGFSEMMLAAAAELFEDVRRVELRDIRFHQVLMVEDRTTVSTTATRSHDGRGAELAVQTVGDEGVIRHATATAHLDGTDESTVDIEGLLAAHPESSDPAEIYQRMRDLGIWHGPSFAGMTALWQAGPGDDTVIGRVELPTGTRLSVADYHLHPVLLDVCLQTLVAHPRVVIGSRLMLPVGFDSLRLQGDPRRATHCVATVHVSDDEHVLGDVRLVAEDGAVVLTVRGVHLRGSGEQRLLRRFNERLLAMEWEKSAPPVTPDRVDGDWLILAEDGADELPESLCQELRERGADASWLSAPLTDDGDRALYDAISHRLGGGEWTGGLVVLGGPVAGEPTEAQIPDSHRREYRLAGVVRAVISEATRSVPRLFVVTRDIHPVVGGDGHNVMHGAMRAVARTVMIEHGELKTTLVDIDPGVTADQLVAEFLGSQGEDEVAWRSGQRYVARLAIAPLREHERRRRDVHFGQDGIAVRPGRSGDLDSLELVVRERTAPRPGHVEIAVHAASLNFADVLNAMGLYQTVDGVGIPLGADCAGVVTAVGEGVTGYRVGDRVAALAQGSLGTFATAPAEALIALPDDVELAEAACWPAVYTTAWYGLVHLARLAPGERVLIHSATGGVGLAALAIARSVGAEVFATAGSEAKRQQLGSMGVQHVFDSRSVEFGDQIRQVTGGEGVDVVLNSLVGAAQRTGVELLRTGGRFIEIGKRDIYADTKLGLYPFRRNISFSSVDLHWLLSERPELVRRLIGEVGAELASGRLDRVPHTEFPLSEASAAFRTMAAAEHVGKLVITFPRTGTTTAVVPPEDVPVVRRDGAYIVTGGLGGLGLLVAEWLAGHEAGRIVLNGRSAPSEQAERLLAELRGAGHDVVVVRGDIAEPDTARALVEAATESGLRLRGVLHGAAVVTESPVALLDAEGMERTLRPKTFGSWYLHEATAGLELDWFFNFSSGTGLVGFPGLGGYGGACSWMDVFTTWQRAQGVPALAVNWGAWADHGLGAVFAERGYDMITPEEGLWACERLLRHDRPRAGYLPISAPQWMELLGTGAEGASSLVARIHSLPEGAQQDGDELAVELLAELRGADADRRRELMEDYVIGRVSTILRTDPAHVEPDQPLKSLGMDSLMALEMRARIEHGLGLRIPTKVLWSCGTPRALGDYLLERLNLAEPGC